MIAFLGDHGVDVVSVTDHDTVDGIPHAVEAGKEKNVEVIPGLELTTNFNGIEIHILGYGIDCRNKTLRRELGRLKNARLLRVKRILAKLREQGVMIHDRDIFADEDVLSGTEAVVSYGRPHIAKALCEKGYAANYKEAFEKYIGNECGAYIPKESLSAIKGIQMLKKAGGIAVIGHPEDTVREEDLEVFTMNGLDGLEVYCPAHDEMQVYHYELMARKNGLIATGGTDMHTAKGYESKLEHLNKDPRYIEDLSRVIPGWDRG